MVLRNRIRNCLQLLVTKATRLSVQPKNRVITQAVKEPAWKGKPKILTFFREFSKKNPRKDFSLDLESEFSTIAFAKAVGGA